MIAPTRFRRLLIGLLLLVVCIVPMPLNSDPGSSVTAFLLKITPFEHRPPGIAIEDNGPRGHEEHPQKLVRVEQ